MLLVIIFVAIFSGIAIIIPSWSIIYNPYGTGRSKLTRGGYFLLLAVAALIVLPAFLYDRQKNDEREKEVLTKIEQEKRDSILRRNYDSSLLVMKLKFDTSNFKTNSIISENLGRYGYKFDSANNQIVKMIKDSSKTKIFEKDDPSLDIKEIVVIGDFKEIQDGENFLKIRSTITSSDAGSCCFDLIYSAVGIDSLHGMTYLTKESPLGMKEQISKNSSASFTQGFEKNKYILIYYWLRGKYKNIDQSKNYEIDQTYFNNLTNNTFGTVRKNSRQKLILFIKDKEK